MRVRFVTSTPLSVEGGSGTFVGIFTLAESLRALGVEVEVVTPKWPIWPYTLKRLSFNGMLPLRKLPECDVTVGFDMDGFALAGKGRGVHIAAVKGVIADEMRFESGITKATMRMQAACERRHVQRADLVITTSNYSSEQISKFYQPANAPRIIPELIDLASWSRLSQANESVPPAGKFIVLSVCRFYPRKRLQVLLAAADRLRSRITGLEVRIVGDGPEASRLKSFWREKRLEGTVSFLGNLSQAELAREYGQCHVFCLPSVQEGFGVVFLEAMANGKPIVAARAGPAPEVVKLGLLVEPDDDENLADAIERLCQQPDLRARLGQSSKEFVRQFDAPVVGRLFLAEMQQMVEARAANAPSGHRNAEEGKPPVR
jgi:glycosyltransferase involved in cell wall biosynthesis